MTISTTENRISYSGNGVTLAFAFPYRFLTDSDLKVYLDDTLKTLTTDYTVTGEGDDAGGTVTFGVAPGNGLAVVIVRDPAATQGLDLVENDSLPAESVEDALDKLTILVQRLQDRVDRALVLVDTDTAVVSTEISPAADYVLGWDATGTEITNLTGLTAGTTVSSAMQPVVTAATLSSARNTLLDPGTSGNVMTSNGTDWESTTRPVPGTFSASVAGNALTISAGRLNITFRSATLGDGTITTISSDPADLIISSGSTLGTTANTLERIAVLALLTVGGDIELAAQKVTYGALLLNSGLLTTTAEGGAGAADSGYLAYSTTARTSRPFVILGYLESNQPVAGTWTVAPSLIQSAEWNTPISSICNQFVTAILTPSGATYDITGIPEWAKEIIVSVDNLSTNGTSIPIIQLGNDAGWRVTSYDGHGVSIAGAGTTVSAAITNGFALDGATAAAVELTGTMRISGNQQWHAQFVGARTSATPTGIISAGVLSTDLAVNKIRLTTVGGVDTFDTGYIQVKARA
jgi:hypothetical protein